MGNKSQGMCWEETRYALQFFGCELCSVYSPLALQNDGSVPKED